MFAKLAVLILVLGSCGGGLLAMRQSRLQAAHELAETRLRIQKHEERLARARSRVAELSGPARVAGLLARIERADPTGGVGAPLVEAWRPTIEVPAELPPRAFAPAGAGAGPR